MIKLPKESIELFEQNYKQIFSSGELAEGKWNDAVADWACEYTGATHALAVNSNGAGLHALLVVLKHYRSKKKIFLQSNTMYGVRTIAISSGLELCGYVDCSLDYLMPTYDQVKDYVDQFDKPEEYVFLVTHIGGWVNPDIQKIADLCKERGISLIEDCAHSLGSLLKGKHTGLFGDAGVYSLYATKAIPVGEGGIVVTNDDDLYQKTKKFSMYDRFDQKLDLGINIRMSEINALLSYAVLQKIDEIIKSKYSIAKRLISACNNSGIEYIDPESNNQRSNLYKFILLSRAEDPVAYFEKITKRTSPVYDYALGRDMFGVSSRHICLPIWYGQLSVITDEIVKELANTNG
ncbi:DegT/DnrJ/EryC1/StrS aminotransferase family protein [Oceanospirillaceae bacterium]|nr:DegT/DnrJ/EryC1/StrS aminotransferase family protein [Oceanospirillaceae bacterium]